MIRFHRSAGRCCIWALVWAVVLTSGLVSLTAAQPKSAASGHGVVDVVTLKSGRILRGGIVSQEPNGSLTMVVSRDWLRNANPTLDTEALAENLERRKTAWTQARDRITERLKSSEDSPDFKFFLKQEQERFEQLIADKAPAEPDFLWFDITREKIAKTTQVSPEQRNIASFAWNERLAQVETRDAGSLTKELAGKDVKLDDSSPDLSERLAARPQNDEEWSLRMDLIEYALGKPVDFQGIGDKFIRTGEGQAINLGEVVPKMFKQQLGSILSGITNDSPTKPKPQNDSGWLKSAIRGAESAKARGFRVTRLQLDAETNRVTVETRFVARSASGKWQSVWRASVMQDGTQARPEVEAQIEKDPQLKSAADALKSFGLVDPRILQQAIRVGAATMAAQQSADAKFGEFRDRYSRHLDGPLLPMAVGQ